MNVADFLPLVSNSHSVVLKIVDSVSKSAESAPITIWQVNSPLPADLAIFLHAVAADGTIVAQHDGLDAVPATLLENDTVLQYHPLPLADWNGLELRVGLYQRNSGQRFVTMDNDHFQFDPTR